LVKYSNTLQKLSAQKNKSKIIILEDQFQNLKELKLEYLDKRQLLNVMEWKLARGNAPFD
jgi:metallophosphoesterase superfamily enzyme